MSIKNWTRNSRSVAGDYQASRKYQPIGANWINWNYAKEEV